MKSKNKVELTEFDIKSMFKKGKEQKYTVYLKHKKAFEKVFRSFKECIKYVKKLANKLKLDISNFNIIREDGLGINASQIKQALKLAESADIDEITANLPKQKFVKLDKKNVDRLHPDLYDLVNTAYKPIGGHLNIKSPSDVKDPELKYWVAADTDKDPEVDVVFFGKTTPFGIKHTGVGHDGDHQNIKKMLTQKTKELKRPGNYVEVSGKAFDSFALRGNVPVINDESKVRKILKGKDIEWYGTHPNKEKPGDGWYVRTIGGSKHAKIMLGVVK